MPLGVKSKVCRTQYPLLGLAFMSESSQDVAGLLVRDDDLKVFHVSYIELISIRHGVDGLPCLGCAEGRHIKIVFVEDNHLSPDGVGYVLDAIGIDADINGLQQLTQSLRALELAIGPV